jgi:hypothetical protein
LLTFIRFISLEFNEDIRHDSGYSSHQDRLLSIPVTHYEPLSECYSGCSFIPSDSFPMNMSSLHSTTDEAYESEPTTISSSITIAHVHPQLEHEFEYPSPPPPVPDRRLKPVHLTVSSCTEQRSIRTSKDKSIAIPAIQQWIESTSNDCSSSIVMPRTLSSRYYCGSIPVSSDLIPSSTNTKLIIIDDQQIDDKPKDKRNSNTLNCLHASAANDDSKRIPWIKSSSSSLNKIKSRTQKTKEFDEATNGLAIRLPASITNEPSTMKTSFVHR